MPPVVDVTDAQVFGAAVSSSAQTPLVLAVYAAEDAGSNALLTSLAQLVQRAGPAWRLAVMEVNELPDVAQQLRISRVPALFTLYKQRVVSSLVVSPTTGPAELATFVKAAAALGPGGGAEQHSAQQATADTAALVAQGWKAVTAALDATAEKRGEATTAAAQALSTALQAAPEGPQRAQALAGLAMAAALSGDAGTAAELVAQAQAAVPAAGPQGPTPMLPEVRAAQALLSLLELAKQEAGDDDGEAGAIHRRGIAAFLAGDVQDGLDDALLLVRKHREWKQSAGRATAVAMMEALGPGDERAAKGRRRLSSLWFA